MSWQALAIVEKMHFLPSSERFVMYMLAYHHNSETGRCDPSLARLEKDTSLTRPTITKALQSLEGQGIIYIQRRSDDRGTLSNQYDLIILGDGSKATLLPHVNSDADLVKPLSGGSKATLPKQKLNNKIIEQEYNREEGADAPTPQLQQSWNSLSAPEGLERFHRILLVADTYWNPKATTWQEILKFVGKLDLESEARKALAWLDDPTKNVKRRQGTPSFIINWLENAVRYSQEAQNGRATQSRAGYLRPGRTLEEIEQSGGRVIRYDNTERAKPERADTE